MVSHDDVRTICRKLPGAIEGEDRFGFVVMVKGKAKGFCWTWAERIHPKKPKVINDQVLAVRVPEEWVKFALIEEDPVVFFTEDHYNGFPAVLVRLEAADPQNIAPLLVEAWRTLAPAKDIAAYDIEQA